VARDETTDFTCKELVAVASDYLENRLPSSERARLEEHLAECEGCTTYLEQMRRTITLIGELREEHVPPEGLQRLLGVFRAWKHAG
jgi:predicted anti-sigma-YlaC factor YlaD